jgi:DedD protein
MAFFKFRKAGDDSAATPRQPESVEAMRRRARHRLIGAAVLVLAGVVGFPLLFDTQPRPVAVDIPIEIPDRNKVKPLSLPRAEPHSPAAAAAASAPAAPVAVAAPVELPQAAKSEEKTAGVQLPSVSPAIKTEAKPEPKLVPKAEPVKAQSGSDGKSADDGAKARGLLDGKPEQPQSGAAAEGRFVVQVGAFADPGKARETRQRVERAGLKTYTHVAETREGKRIRVRVGPFANRAEADKAAEKIKGLDLPAAILTL